MAVQWLHEYRYGCGAHLWVMCDDLHEGAAAAHEGVWLKTDARVTMLDGYNVGMLSDDCFVIHSSVPCSVRGCQELRQGRGTWGQLAMPPAKDGCRPNLLNLARHKSLTVSPRGVSFQWLKVDSVVSKARPLSVATVSTRFACIAFTHRCQARCPINVRALTYTWWTFLHGQRKVYDTSTYRAPHTQGSVQMYIVWRQT